jgi:hypothetical protein
MDKFKAQGFRCHFTGETLERENASLDHLQPISKGGQHNSENIQLVHIAINRMKGRMTAEEFIDWCVKVAVHSGCCVLNGVEKKPEDLQERAISENSNEV